MKLTEYEPHPYAEIFPFRDDDTLTALADAIADPKIGQKEEIVLFEGKVLDGRRRQAACIMRGVTPIYRQFGSRPLDGKDALEYAFAQFHRRDDLSPGEKTIAAAKYSTFKFGENQYSGRHKKEGAANAGPSKTQAEAAKKFKTSVDQIQRAKKVMEEGCPELIEAVRQDLITISDAAAIADEPPEVQKKAVEAVKKNKTRTAKKAVQDLKGEIPDAAGELAQDLEAFVGKLAQLDASDTATRDKMVKKLREICVIVGRLKLKKHRRKAG